MEVLRNIHADFESYSQLVGLYECHKNDLFDTLELSLQRWFNANMAAPLGVILDKISSGINTIKLVNLDSEIQSILQKNLFLSYYGFAKKLDENSTTVSYQKLKPTDSRFFADYIEKDLLNRTELPSMSTGLIKKMNESILEVFANAQIHSKTKNIYTCGQFFPKKGNLEFCICDGGIGFKERFRERFNKSISSIDAIQWALVDSHTTKKQIAGGIGLALIKEFIGANKGTLQIVSDRGFYEFSPNGEISKTLPSQFPGSVINLQFITNDPTNYCLSSELASI